MMLSFRFGFIVVMLVLAQSTFGQNDGGTYHAAEDGSIRESPTHSSTPLRFVQGAENPAAAWWDQKEAPECGLHALYMFLKLSGASVSEASLGGRVTSSGKGASMLELKEAAAHSGIAAEVYECTIDDFRSLQLPILARLARDNTSDQGHYVVVTRFDEDGVAFLDGATGRRVLASTADFEKTFSGFVLTSRKSVPWLLYILIGVVLVELLVLLKPNHNPSSNR